MLHQKFEYVTADTQKRPTAWRSAAAGALLHRLLSKTGDLARAAVGCMGVFSGN
jgi:hypothetical protein